MKLNYKGFIILDIKNQKEYRFPYTGSDNVKSENQAILELMEKLDLLRSNFFVYGFIK
jgi:hypothetical protein